MSSPKNLQNDIEDKSNLSTTVEEGFYQKQNIINFNLFSFEPNANNIKMFQKYLFYQIKKSFLKSKKNFGFNSNLNKTGDENNTSTTSMNDYLTNIFNVNYSKVFTGVKIQYVNFQNTILINDYIIFKDEIICKGNKSILYKGKKNDNEEYYVKFFFSL